MKEQTHTLKEWEHARERKSKEDKKKLTKKKVMDGVRKSKPTEKKTGQRYIESETEKLIKDTGHIVVEELVLRRRHGL